MGAAIGSLPIPTRKGTRFPTRLGARTRCSDTRRFRLGFLLRAQFQTSWNTSCHSLENARIDRAAASAATERGFARYVALGILGRNLHTLGKLVIRQQNATCEAAQSQRKPAA